MKFSIIIPTYNRSKFIIKAINSVLAQKYNNYELIIIDDGSTDDTEEVVRPYLNEKIRYKKVENRERGAARNRGIELATGDFITFFDSDDIILPSYLEEANNLLVGNSEIQFLHFGYEMKNPEGGLLSTHNKIFTDANRALIEGNYMSCIGAFVKKEFFEAVKFNEDRKLAASEDWLLWLQLSARVKIFQSPKITSYMINHDERSVLQFNESKLIDQMLGVLSVLTNDKLFVEQFGTGALKAIHARYLSYIALHALMAKQKSIGLKYLCKSICKNPKELKYRRTLACVKKIFF